MIQVTNILLCLALAFGFPPTTTSHYTQDTYFSKSEMPDLVKLRLAPPKNHSIGFTYDIMRYEWGKEQRKDSWRSAIAVRDAVYSLRTITNEFSEPFGMIISEKETPEIYHLLKVALPSCDNICVEPKKYYMRKRPFVYFQESTITPWDEAGLSKNGSFPSGHTILGWSAALLLSEINPERADTLIARGRMFGESRVIVGVHWESDVQAGFIAGNMAVMKLHTCPRFLDDMKRAKAEFRRKRQIE